MARHGNLHKEDVKTPPDPSRRLAVAEVHARTGVGKPTLARWQRELSEDGGNAVADPSAPPRPRLVTLADSADQLMREAEEVCCREHGVSRGQMEGTRDMLAGGGRARHR